MQALTRVPQNIVRGSPRNCGKQEQSFEKPQNKFRIFLEITRKFVSGMGESGKISERYQLQKNLGSTGLDSYDSIPRFSSAKSGFSTLT
jgi:hypothetical protein